MGRVLIAAVLAAGLSATARAQDYPSRPVTMVVPFTSGGSTEIMARLITQGLETKLGKPVILLEALDRVLARVAGEPLSRFYEAEHRAHGVEVRLGIGVGKLIGRDGRVAGVTLADGEEIAADAVLVAAGARSAALHPALDGLVRPVKGEILRLAHRPGAFPAPVRTVRALVDGRPVYAVPRDGGGLVVGATQADVGFDTEPTVGGVRDLLRDVERVLPGVAEFALLEVAAGLRPGSPDNLPLIGGLGPDGPLVATGHHRNGILLAPSTAAAIGDLVTSGRMSAAASHFGLARFSRAAATPAVMGA